MGITLSKALRIHLYGYILLLSGFQEIQLLLCISILFQVLAINDFTWFGIFGILSWSGSHYGKHVQFSFRSNERFAKIYHNARNQRHHNFFLELPTNSNSHNYI